MNLRKANITEELLNFSLLHTLQKNLQTRNTPQNKLRTKRGEKMKEP
jgi:hypothetical protein